MTAVDDGARFRCSTASRAASEPLAGTASTVVAFLLVEAAGPWGTDAVRDSRLPLEVRDWLGTVERRHGVRPLLVRRPGRAVLGPQRVFAAYAGTGESWLGGRILSDVQEVCDLDLTGLRKGPLEGFETEPGPVFLVCTHGRHDACCAERGRPLAAALARVAPDETWEVSHIGGDRFAANVLVLPTGHYYGRVEPADAQRFAADVRAGRVDLAHLRGRTAYPFAVQVAEVHLRRHLGAERVRDVQVVAHQRSGAETVAILECQGDRWRARVRTTREDRRRLTCRGDVLSQAPSHQLLALEHLGSS